jgi:hypothetical protein
MENRVPNAAETAGEIVNLLLNKDQEELSSVLKTLRPDPSFMGCFSLGTDGIMRSLTTDRDVIDAVALSPRLIKAHLDRMPFDQKTEDTFRGVDGTGVPREKWFHPDKSLLPPPMSEEVKEQTKKVIEENKELFAKKDYGGCGVVVRSDYNLGPKKGLGNF